MDPQAFKDWWKEMEESDDELDLVVANHVLLLQHAITDDSKIQAVLDRVHGGSRPGRRPNLPREHVEGHARIMRDYFSDNPKYPDNIFCRRFRMRKQLFMRIHDQLIQHCPFFVQRPDAARKPGLSSIQKMTAAIRMFAYGSARDALDEYVQIGESTAIASFKEFVDGIVKIFEDKYLRSPTVDDVKKHMDLNAARGFAGMFGSLECTHWVWKNCPVSLQGQYRDKDGLNSIVLEAIATYDLWIWHAFIGIPGSNNDINTIDRSPLLVNMLNGVAPAVSFDVNGHNYKMFYLLCDGIYPDYTIFMKTISTPLGNKRKWFARKQEAARKDIERCFGVLQARFAMIRNPARWWDEDQLITVWKAAIIMHNMIIEDEETHEELTQEYLFENAAAVYLNRGHPQVPLTFSILTNAIDRIKDKETVSELQSDLIEHLWAIKGQENHD